MFFLSQIKQNSNLQSLTSNYDEIVGFSSNRVFELSVSMIIVPEGMC